MYQPQKYKKEDQAYIFKFIQQHPFAAIVSNGNRLMATHIPILTEGNSKNFKLYSHIANHNDQLKYLNDGDEVLLIFQGAQGYISSSWYEEKDISTWDYSAVHINAKVIRQSSEELEQSLIKLVRRFEKPQPKPLYYEEIPRKMREEHLPLITGFWLEPTKIEAIAKLHQGYKKQDIINVITELESESGNTELSKNIKDENKDLLDGGY